MDLSDRVSGLIQQNLSNFQTWFNNLNTWITSLKTSIVDSITNFVSNIGTWFTDLFTRLGDWFAGIGDWFSSLYNLIGDFFDKFWDWFVSLWIPSDLYLNSRFSSLKELLEGKALASQYISVLKSIENIKDTGSPDDIIVNLYGFEFVLVDYTWVRKLLPTVWSWMRGIVFFFLIVFNFNQVYKLIRGVSFSERGSAGSGGSTK